MIAWKIEKIGVTLNHPDDMWRDLSLHTEIKYHWNIPPYDQFIWCPTDCFPFITHLVSFIYNKKVFIFSEYTPYSYIVAELDSSDYQRQVFRTAYKYNPKLTIDDPEGLANGIKSFLIYLHNNSFEAQKTIQHLQIEYR